MVKVTKKILLKKKVRESRKKSVPGKVSKKATNVVTRVKKQKSIVSQFVVTEPYIQNQITSLLTSVPEKKKRVRHLKVTSEPEPLQEIQPVSSVDTHAEDHASEPLSETLVQTIPETFHNWETTPVQPLEHLIEPMMPLQVTEVPEATIVFTPDMIEALKSDNANPIHLIHHEPISEEVLQPIQEIPEVIQAQVEPLQETNISLEQDILEVEIIQTQEVKTTRNLFKIIFRLFIKFFTEFAKPYTPSQQ